MGGTSADPKGTVGTILGHPFWMTDPKLFKKVP